MTLNEDDACAWHTWFAWHPVRCADINGVRIPAHFFMLAWLENVYRRSAPGTEGRHWVYCYEDPYDGYES